MTRRRILVVATIALLALGVWLVPRLGTPSAVAVPEVDVGAMPGPVARAITSARETVLEAPRSARAWGELGAVLDAHQLYDEAATCYRQAHRLDPADFSWAYLLATVEDLRGAEAEAIVGAFRTAIELNPLYPPAALRFGDALTRLGRMAEARAAYERAVELDPDFAMAHRGLGQVLLASGDPEGGIDALEIAARLDPEDAIAHNDLARGYRMLGDREASEAAAAKGRTLRRQLAVPDPIRYAVDQKAVSPTACLRRGQESLREGAWDRAVPDLELYVEMRPDDAQGLLALGVAYINVGEHERGLSQLARAVSLKPDLVEAHLHLATLWNARGQRRQARQHLDQALRFGPEEPEVHARLALAAAAEGDLDGAVAGFDRAVELDPTNVGYRHNLAAACLNRGDLDRAEAELRTVLQIVPAAPDSLYLLGLVLERSGRTDESVALYRRAAEVAPDHAATRRLTELGR